MQLLVSDSDVKSYKQIKDDLDDLRLLVEKSELWVYKAVKQEDKKVREWAQKIRNLDIQKFSIAEIWKCRNADTLGEGITALAQSMFLCWAVGGWVVGDMGRSWG